MKVPIVLGTKYIGLKITSSLDDTAYSVSIEIFPVVPSTETTQLDSVLSSMRFFLRSSQLSFNHLGFWMRRSILR